jgi:Uma2 family endonuclease
MAEPARKTSRGESRELDSGLPDDELSDIVLLQRWVERPDGRMELLEIPLTPEDFLNPRYGDKWLQGREHSELTLELFELLKRRFEAQPDVVVMSDVQHRFGPRLDKPCPDVSVVRGVRDPGKIQDSFDVRKVGVRPCLLIEVVSPKDPRIRRVDEEDKVQLYERVGIPEYLLVRPRRKGGREIGPLLRLRGYRLGPDGRYQPIEPDEKGRILSQTTGLRFAVSPSGDRIDVFDARTGRRLRRPVELEEARKAAETKAAREAKARREAETKAAREAEARKAAEEELTRLRSELERLERPGKR